MEQGRKTRKPPRHKPRLRRDERVMDIGLFTAAGSWAQVLIPDRLLQVLCKLEDQEIPRFYVRKRLWMTAVERGADPEIRGRTSGVFGPILSLPI